MSSKRKSSLSNNIQPLQKRSCTASSNSNDSQVIENSPRKIKDGSNWGIIESISLRNFMCHSRLTMRFTSSVNFIVGHNGSGKSAVLTGIIVGLGGKATSTNRGNSLKTLIKSGSNAATVEITLRNNGEDPVKPDVYGNKICVERRITSDGTTTYKIKSASGKLISSKKEDLLRILDEIGLHVDNPLTCLNQEMSKNFLHSKNENDKYKFFLKATQLDQMRNDYRLIEEQKILIKGILDNKQKVIPEREKDVLEKEQRFKDLFTLQELKKKVESLKCELAWSHVVQLEHSLKPLKKDLERENLRAPKYDDALQKCMQEETVAQKKFEDLKKMVKQYQQKIKSLEPDCKKAKSSLDQAKSQCKSNENALNRAKKQLRETENGKRQMEIRIEELKNSAKTNVEEEKKKRDEQLSCLLDRANELQAKLKTTSHQLEQFALATEQAKDKEVSCYREIKELERDQKKYKHTLSSLSTGAGKQDKLRLFGVKMPEFVRKIDEAFARQKFKQKPRGPIGSCVTLKDQSLAVAVECAISSVISSFVVDNHHDEKVLEQLRNSVFSPQERARITIYTVTFTNQVHDVTRGKAIHDSYLTVLDLVNIEDPVITNCLIDLKSIEVVLVIPDTAEALRVIQENRPPRNCIKAYTKLGDEVYADRYYSNNGDRVSRFLKADMEGEIARNRNLLKEVEDQLQLSHHEAQKAKNIVTQNQQEYRRHEKNKSLILQQLTAIKTDIRDIEGMEDPQPIDVKDLEDEVLNYNQQIASIEMVIQDHAERLEGFKKQKKESEEVYAKFCNEIKKIGETAEDLPENVNLAYNEVEKAKTHATHYRERKKEHQQTVRKIQTEMSKKEEQIKVETEKALIVCQDKIITRRTPNNLENEIKQINLRISSEESQHGNHEIVVREYHEAREKFNAFKSRIRWSKNFLGKIEDYLVSREKSVTRMRYYIANRCQMDFSTLLSQRGFTGNMKFDHEQQLLFISVKPHENSSQSSDLRVLSGGERSFSTVCYVLALWQAIQSPLRCLDEFDVFMDMANRRVAMDMMVEMALLEHHKQFIFLTPHDISSLPKSARLHVWKMADPDRTQTHLPFTPI